MSEVLADCSGRMVVLGFGDELDKGTTRNLCTTGKGQNPVPLPESDSARISNRGLQAGRLCSLAASSVKFTSVTEAFKAAPRKDRNAGVEASARVSERQQATTQRKEDFINLCHDELPPCGRPSAPPEAPTERE